MRQDDGSVSTPPVRRRNRSLAPTTKPASARSLIPVVSGVEANTCPVRSSSQASSAGEPWRTRARRLRDTRQAGLVVRWTHYPIWGDYTCPRTRLVSDQRYR